MGTALICLDENSALDFLSGRLGAPALAETEKHLGVCEACVELLARSAPFLPSRADGSVDFDHRVSPAVSTMAMRVRREPTPPRTIERSGDRDALDAISGEIESRNDSGRDDLDHLDHLDNDSPDPPPTLGPGTVLKDTYTVMSLIGRGGMGEVYEVTHARLAGRYALKLLPPAFALEHVSVTRFRREANITSAMRHANIVQVIDFDHTPAGQPFLVMEHLDGGDLSQLMAGAGPMPLPRVLTIVAQIVSALSAVHRRGIVHRDLKPQNVLLVRDDDPIQDRVKLVDFGLSKRNETSLFGMGAASISRERTLLGTPRYMAPEQASGRIDEIDATTDQFALGAMVYEMLTGVSAFSGDHIALLLYRIVSEDPAAMRSIVSDLPEHVEAAVRRAMSKQRSDRFATVNDFFDALAGSAGVAAAMGSERGARLAAVVTPGAGTSTYAPGRAGLAIVTPAGGTPGAPLSGADSSTRSLEAPVEAPARPRRGHAALGIALGIGLAVGVAGGISALRTHGVTIAGPTSGRAAPVEPARAARATEPSAAAPAEPTVPVPAAQPPKVEASAPTLSTKTESGERATGKQAAVAAPTTAESTARVHGAANPRHARGSKRRASASAVDAAAPSLPPEPPADKPSPPEESKKKVGRLVESL